MFRPEVLFCVELQLIAICRYDPLVLKLIVSTVVVVRCCCCHLDLWESLCRGFHVRSFICSSLNGDEAFWRSRSAVPMGIHRPLCGSSFCSLKFIFFVTAYFWESCWRGEVAERRAYLRAGRQIHSCLIDSGFSAYPQREFGDMGVGRRQRKLFSNY